MTSPSENKVLLEFYYKIQPYGVGWDGFLKKNNLVKFENNNESPMKDILLMFLGIITVYFGLFGTGYLIYNDIFLGSFMIIISFSSAFLTNYIMSNVYKG